MTYEEIFKRCEYMINTGFQRLEEERRKDMCFGLIETAEFMHWITEEESDALYYKFIENRTIDN